MKYVYILMGIQPSRNPALVCNYYDFISFFLCFFCKFQNSTQEQKVFFFPGKCATFNIYHPIPVKEKGFLKKLIRFAKIFFCHA